jgi:hypothetical protein
MNEEIIKLKSQAYDCMVVIQQHQQLLQQINQKITQLIKTEKKEDVDSKV